MAKKFDYTGVELLESLESAKNYNNYLLSLIIKSIGLRQNKKVAVLDFGAGTGMYARMINEKFAIKPTCLDPDENLRNRMKNDGFEVLADSKNVKKFATIYALNVFEHIEKDARVAKDLAKTMSPGSTLLIYVPASQILFSSMDRKVEHYRRYNKKYLQSLLDGSGLRTLEIHYVDPLGFFAALLYKIIDRGNGSVSEAGIKLFDKFVFPLSLLIQPLTKRVFGKNLVAIAIKD